MQPKILIVGTVPYNKRSTSRAFEAYFHNWNKENCAQIFSNTKKPCKGHCGTLYQITDHSLLKRWFGSKEEIGKIYNYDDLDTEWKDSDVEIEGKALRKAYKIGEKHTAETHLLRGLLWRKRLWCTEKLTRWLDAFHPNCVFLSFSDDYFILQIALYVAHRYDIPIISSIGDDYYFNKHFSLSPTYHLYKETYKALVRKTLAHQGSAIYISDKIRDKYNSEFQLDGETVYLSSEISRKPFSVIDTVSPVITYFGNIRMGRNHSLNQIGYALGKINPNYVLEIYSGERDKKYYDIFSNNPNVKFFGSIAYAEVKKRMSESDITIIVEGFKPKDVELSRYSLSTKAADALACGCAILTYGSQECGIVEYMQSTNASAVCFDPEELEQTISKLICDTDLQKQYYNNAIQITEKHHNLEMSCKTFEAVVKKALRKG